MNTAEEKTNKVRVRFAPSPTGALHIGGLRTALYNFLFARHAGGIFLVRIEDTDRKRVVPGAEEGIMSILQRFGMMPDEPTYRQSERLALYRSAAEQLVTKGLAYPCFCSAERLEKLRAEQEKTKQQPRYDGLCRALDSAKAKLRQTNEPHVIRFSIPTGLTTAHDIIHDNITVNNATLDDFVIIKTDGFPTYHLASVVDDHNSNITHVIRGDEWLPSLPKHILLYQAFSWQTPQFVHLPLLLGAAKKKLSKREADVSVQSYLDQGYLESALLNFIATLGWNPTADREQYTSDELIKLFDITAINKSGAMVNFEKLRWLNREYLKALATDEYYERARLFYERALEKVSMAATVPAHKVLDVLRERIAVFSDISNEELRFLATPQLTDPNELVWRQANREDTLRYLTEIIAWLEQQPIDFFSAPSPIESAVLSWIQERGYPIGSVLWPVRYALSGTTISPSPFVLIWLFGQTTSLHRLRHALNQLTNSI